MFRWTADIMDMIFCCAKNFIHVMGKVGRKAGLICIGEYYAPINVTPHPQCTGIGGG